MYYYNNEYLQHYGVKGMKWGVRRNRTSTKEAEQRVGTFKASNGMKVAPAKNAYVRTMRKVAANRMVENVSKNSYRKRTGKYMDTVKNRMDSAKGENQIRKESQALREYHAHLKDAKKGTGSKYLDKAVRKNKLDDAYEDVKTATTKIQAMFYNDATRKKAAKYVVDKNMSVKEATKKANKEAIRNTALILGAYGAYATASLYAINKKYN